LLPFAPQRRDRSVGLFYQRLQRGIRQPRCAAESVGDRLYTLVRRCRTTAMSAHPIRQDEESEFFFDYLL
jgi:hypothetical protein